MTEDLHSATQSLELWARYYAMRAKVTKGSMFVEPELTEMCQGWDEIVAKFPTNTIDKCC